jgi:hypothetical protein
MSRIPKRSTLVVLTLCSFLLGLVGNIAASILPRSFRPYLWLAWPLFAALSLMCIVLLLRPSDESFVTAMQANTLKQKLDNTVVRSETANEFIAASVDPHIRGWLVDYLLDQIEPGAKRRADPTERYWIYNILGEIGTRKARIGLVKGFEDENAFARQGATEAWNKMNSRSWLKWI